MENLIDSPQEQEYSGRQAEKVFNGIADNLVMRNYRTFTIATFNSICTSQNLSFQQIGKLFSKWTKRQLKDGKIKVIPSIDLTEGELFEVIKL